uniref:Uncharacterized protein n=1 Tax=Arundo donax TaxID=35708 RepID=A0A0A9BZU6_ARUDO
MSNVLRLLKSIICPHRAFLSSVLCANLVS